MLWLGLRQLNGGKCLNSHCKEALTSHRGGFVRAIKARVALSLFPRLAPPPVPLPSRLAGVGIPGAPAWGWPGALATITELLIHLRAGTGAPRNSIHIPKSSPGYPCAGTRGLCPTPTFLSPGTGPFPAAGAARGASLSTDIHLWVRFLLRHHPLGSCRGVPAPHQSQQRTEPFPQHSLAMCQPGEGTLLSPPCSARHHEPKASPRSRKAAGHPPGAS